MRLLLNERHHGWDAVVEVAFVRTASLEAGANSSCRRNVIDLDDLARD